jgi:hypothetical protein
VLRPAARRLRRAAAQALALSEMSATTERLAEVNSGKGVDFEPAAEMPEFGEFHDWFGAD